MVADACTDCEPGAAICDPGNFYDKAIKGVLGPALEAAAKGLTKREFIQRYHQSFLETLKVTAIEADPGYQEAQGKIRSAKTRHRDH